MFLFSIKILLFPVVFLAIAFFEGSETVLTGLSKINLDQLKAQYPHRKLFFEFWERYPDRVLAALGVGNTLSMVMAGVLAASVADDLVLQYGFPGAWFIPAFTFLVGLLIFIFCEVLPKIFGRMHGEALAGWVILPLVPFTKAMHPMVQVLVWIAGLFIRVLGAQVQKEIPPLTSRELKGMLEEPMGSQSPMPSRRILRNILDLGEMTVGDILKPRDKIFAIDLKKSPKEVLELIAKSPYSRIPVYNGLLDNIVGIIYSKDLLTSWRTEGLILIPDLLRPAYFTSENILISELLHEFKKGRHHFALVYNAEGKVSGMVTIEDILEQIVGPVYDDTELMAL